MAADSSAGAAGAAAAAAAAVEVSSSNRVIGCARRFNTKLGYGFITVISSGENNGKDIFVHQTSLNVGNASRRRMLYKGECVEFDIAPSGKPEHPFQAINVSGYNGNGLMCDNSAIMFRVPQQQFGNGGGRPGQQRNYQRGPRRQQQQADAQDEQ